MKIDISEHRNVFIVSVAGKMDAINAPKLEKAISIHVETGEKTIILDFDKLDYISSAGLRVVLMSAKQLKANRQELMISGLKNSVKNVFELSGFYSLFKIFNTIEAAREEII
jgi:anti-anti-sigma factor